MGPHVQPFPSIQKRASEAVVKTFRLHQSEDASIQAESYRPYLQNAQEPQRTRPSAGRKCTRSCPAVQLHLGFWRREHSKQLPETSQIRSRRFKNNDGKDKGHDGRAGSKCGDRMCTRCQRSRTLRQGRDGAAVHKPGTLRDRRILSRLPQLGLCREGDTLDSRQTNILKILGVRMSEFKIDLKAVLDKSAGTVREIGGMEVDDAAV